MASADRIGYTSDAPQYVYNPANFQPPTHPHYQQQADNHGPMPSSRPSHPSEPSQVPYDKAQVAQVNMMHGDMPPTPASPMPPPPPYPGLNHYNPGDVDQSYFPPPPTSPSAQDQQATLPQDLKYQPYAYPPPQTSPQLHNQPYAYPPTPQTPAIQAYPQSPLPVVQPTPQRPVFAPQFSQPYIAPTHNPSLQHPGLNVPQFAHPPSHSPQPPPNQPLLAPQTIPQRPLSAPPVQDPQSQPGQAYDPTVDTGTLSHAISAPAAIGAQPQDDLKTGTATRFVGNMLVVRGARAVYSTVRATTTLPFYLSPWGDNNPITLPNVRKRDAALACVMHIGIGELAPAALDVVDHAVQTGVTLTAEQAVDSAHHKMSGVKPHKITRQGHVNSLTIRIRHKLLGEDAVVQLFGQKESVNKAACAKGWFCPYLYASGRTLYLERSADFSMAQVYGPGLAADASVAPTLLTSITAEDAPIIAACPYQSPCPTFTRFRRLAICLLGISPYRTATAWSQAKIPNEARLTFHLLTHLPMIVLPVGTQAPICAWSPWTLQQMLYNGDGYDLSKHYYDLLHYLESIVDESLMDDQVRPRWREIVGQGLGKLFEGVEQLKMQVAAIEKVNNYDLNRAGIVMFRY